MKKISIILTTLNEEKNVEKMFLKIQDAFSNYEIIIVDDNSTDKTIDKIKEFNNNKTVIIRRKIKQGLASAIYRGVIESSGDYLCWLDISMEHHIENIKNEMKNLETNDIIVFSR